VKFVFIQNDEYIRNSELRKSRVPSLHFLVINIDIENVSDGLSNRKTEKEENGIFQYFVWLYFEPYSVFRCCQILKIISFSKIKLLRRNSTILMLSEFAGLISYLNVPNILCNISNLQGSSEWFRKCSSISHCGLLFRANESLGIHSS